MAALICGVAACPKKTAPGPSLRWDGPADEEAIGEAASGPEGAPVLSGILRGGGLVVTVPEGWEGRRGPANTPLVARLAHGRTGVIVEIWSYPRQGSPAARPRPGCEPLVVDAGAYRAVPGLGHTTVRECVYDDGTVVQGWYGAVARREVHVEVMSSPSEVFAGRLAVEPLLQTLGVDQTSSGGVSVAPGASSDQ